MRLQSALKLTMTKRRPHALTTKANSSKRQSRVSLIRRRDDCVFFEKARSASNESCTKANEFALPQSLKANCRGELLGIRFC